MPSDQPKLSVLLSAFNAELFIEEAIQSILAQSFSEFELLIADDGSSDRTRERIDSFSDSRIVRLHNDRNLGKSATINKLAMHAKGEYLTIHDADDISLPRRFDKQISWLEKDPNHGMVGVCFEKITQEGHFIGQQMMPATDEAIRSVIFQKSAFHGPTVIFRKVLLQKGEPVLRTFFNDYNEDCDLNLRLIQRAQGSNLPEVLYKYRILPGSLSKQLTPEKRRMYKLLSWLAQQRAEFGKDVLMNGKEEDARVYLDTLTKPYREDPGRIHRENAALQLYHGFHISAIKNCRFAVTAGPLSAKNWMTLQYCLRVVILRTAKQIVSGEKYQPYE